MKRLPIILCSFLLICACANKTSMEHQHQIAVKEVISKRYLGLNQIFLGDPSPMLELWSKSENATYLGPTGGIKKGWTEIRREWLSQADMKLGGQVTGYDFHYYINGTTAVVSNIERGENINSEGAKEVVNIRATHVLVLEDEGWKIISEHTDILPFLN